MANAKRVCIFCGEAMAERAKEHVLARGLLKALSIYERKIHPQLNRLILRDPDPARSGADVYLSGITRIHPLSAFVNGAVCKACNNGWMNRLEAESRPHLLALIRGEIELSSLSGDERLSLARWAAKTAYAWCLSCEKVVDIPADHPMQVRSLTNTLPPGVLVFGGRAKTPAAMDFNISSDWVVQPAIEGQQDQHERFRLGSYKISFQLFSLHLMVAFPKSPAWVCTSFSADHHLIYPDSAPFLRDTGVAQEPLMPSWMKYKRTEHLGFHMRLGVTQFPSGGDSHAAPGHATPESPGGP